MTDNALIPQTQLSQVIALDNTVRESRRLIVEAESSDSTMMKALVLAKATRAIRDQLKPMMPDIMQLVGSPLGFKTDRDRPRKRKGPDGREEWDNSKYSVDDVQDIVTVALLRGFQLVGNEINIIAGSFYATKEGLERQIREFPGLTDLELEAGVPQDTVKDGVLFPYAARWKLRGTPYVIECKESWVDGKKIADTRIPVRRNDAMGIDALYGKAKSKMYRRIWERLTGSQQSCVEDFEDDDAIDAVATPTIEHATAAAAIEGPTDHQPPGETMSNQDEPNQPTGETMPDSPPQQTGNASDQIFAEFLNGIAAATKSGEAIALYDAWFGPDSTREFSPEQNERAAQAANAREQALLPQRGPRAGKGKQQQLQGAS